MAEGLLRSRDIVDPWGNAIRVTGNHPYPRLVSAGVDGEFDTSDDLIFEEYEYWEGEMMMDGAGPPIMRRPRMPRKMNGRGGAPMAVMAAEAPREANGRPKKDLAKAKNGGSGHGGGDEPRIRSFFPETLFVQPSLITDGRGHARTTVSMADSITTWRMSAMASSTDGRLGSRSDGLLVFQDFFIDIDFPATLTQGDEIEIPIGIFNYLKVPQQVRLEAEIAEMRAGLRAGVVCEACGFSNEDGSRFCSACGEALTAGVTG